MRLGAFEGDWIIERTIADALDGRPGRLDGAARFQPDGAGLAYVEEGLLRLGDAPPVAATRSYLWREEPHGGIAVLFADGRFFHRFDPSAPRPEAAHDCAPDRYVVRYDFTAWPAWESAWRVRGPRKDYAMTTRFRPAGAP